MCVRLYRVLSCCVFFFFFVKQKTAYEMRISDWSSDVCSSDLQQYQGGDHGGRFEIDGDSSITSPEGCRENAGRQGRYNAIGPRNPCPHRDQREHVEEIGRAHADLQSLMRISYAVFCLNKTKTKDIKHAKTTHNMT